MPNLNREICPHCGQTINSYRITLNKSMVRVAYKLYVYLKSKNQQLFTRKEITECCQEVGTAYTMFGSWVYFGGLFYKEEKGHWGINFQRCDDFFHNRLSINSVLTKKVKREYQLSDPVLCSEVKGVKAFLNDKNEWVSNYTNL